jgi:hypothetical protein
MKGHFFLMDVKITSGVIDFHKILKKFKKAKWL